jgi:uncharacterized iron-regulated membrane protein
MGWHEGREWGRTWMAVVAREQGFTVNSEQTLSYDPHRGLFRYRVQSDRDVRETGGSTAVWFDAATGALRGTYVPTGQALGDTVTTWLLTLHMAAVWGLPFKVFVTVVGIVVAVLGVTGVVIWWRKRRGRAGRLAARPSRAHPRADSAPGRSGGHPIASASIGVTAVGAPLAVPISVPAKL